jgi:hypothetical protein
MTAHVPAIKKIVTFKEDIFQENQVAVRGTVRRAWVAAVLSNPAKGLDDMQTLTDWGADLGQRLGQIALQAIDPAKGEPLAYGKSAIVGEGGLLEHGAAILHPKLGKPLRELIGQGKSIIPSSVKQAGSGSIIDIPLHAADNEWDFSLLDAITATVPGAPLPHEIVVFVALACGGRAAARIGVSS